MPKQIDVNALKIKVFKAFVGKLTIKTILQDKNKIEVECNACKFNYVIPLNFTIKHAAKLTCKSCQLNSQKHKFTNKQKQLAHYMLESLYFSEGQICDFFAIKKKDLMYLKPENLVEQKSHGLIVMAIDPGTLNAGLSVVQIWGRHHVVKAKPLHCRMLVNTFKNINSFDFEYKFGLLLAEVMALVEQFKPDVFVIERYQSRGGFSNASNETVNMIITYLVTQINNHVSMFKILTPAGWKARTKVIFDLKTEYKQIAPLTPHMLDSCMMAVSVFPDDENPFKWLEKRSKRAKFYKRLLRVSPQLRYKHNA